MCSHHPVDQHFSKSYNLYSMIHQLTKLLSIILALTVTLIACGQTEGEVIENFVGEASGYGIFGRVWLDADGDGLQDIGEAGLSGAPVNLLAEGLLIDATVTGQDGAYKFENLPDQDYVVEFEAPPGFVFSPKDQADDKLDSDANPSTGRTDIIKERSGLFILNMDAGLIPPGPDSDSLQAATPTPSPAKTSQRHPPHYPSYIPSQT